MGNYLIKLLLLFPPFPCVYLVKILSRWKYSNNIINLTCHNRSHEICMTKDVLSGLLAEAFGRSEHIWKVLGNWEITGLKCNFLGYNFFSHREFKFNNRRHSKKIQVHQIEMQIESFVCSRFQFLESCTFVELCK